MVRAHLFILLTAMLFLVSCGLVEDVDEDIIVQEKENKALDYKKLAQCGNNVCEDGENRCSCAIDCGLCEGNITNITMLTCEDGGCKEVPIPNICGNNMCEDGETGVCELDCPKCDDKDICTKDVFDEGSKTCKNIEITPCCGNSVCESGESTSCIRDCPSGTDLRDYPEIFVKNDKLEALIIVGDGGAELVIAGINIIRGLDFGEAAEGYTVDAQLDTEVSSIANKNAILIGNPCHNKFVAALYKKNESTCLHDLSPGDKIIELFRTGDDTHALVISGYEEHDIREASVALEKHNESNLSGVRILL